MLKEVYLDYSDKKQMLVIAKALANEARINILELLNERSLNVNEIAEALGLPTSTAAMNVRILENAGLLFTESQPGIRGSMKVSSRVCDKVTFRLMLGEQFNTEENTVVTNMPIGNFVNCEIHPTCGIVNEKNSIGIFDQPGSFYFPERTSAQLLWFFKGYVEYRFPITIAENGTIHRLEISFEASSEAPFYRNDWPSDITLWINDVEIGTWTSPGDFGGRRGKQNPSWWPESLNQYGLLKSWVVDKNGTSLDDEKLSSVRLEQLHLLDSCFTSVKIGIKEDAKNVGGVSLFGERFGDFSQNIVMRIDYRMV